MRARPALACALAVAAALGAGAAATLSPATTPLPVGVLLRPELIPLSVEGGEAKPGKRYTVTGLTPGTAYEVRVSHPSTVPAVVGIAIETSVGLPRTSPLGRELRRRSLLDTTRAALALGANDQPLSVIVTVNATSRGFYPPGRGGGPPPALPVAITVERLVGGFLPADARPVVCVCAVLMAAVLVAVPAWADGGVRRVGEWLDGGHHRPEEEEDEVEGKAR